MQGFTQNVQVFSLLLHKAQGSCLLIFQNCSGFSLIVDTLIADTECNSDVINFVTSLEEICLKCDYVMAGDLTGIMFNHVSDFQLYQ